MIYLSTMPAPSRFPCTARAALAAAEQQGHCPQLSRRTACPSRKGTGAMPCIAEAEGGEMKLTTGPGLQSCPESVRGSKAPEQTVMIPTLWDCPFPHLPALSTHMYKSRLPGLFAPVPAWHLPPTTPFQPATGGKAVKRDLAGGAVVKTAPQCRGLGSIPCRGVKIPHAVWCRWVMWQKGRRNTGKEVGCNI